MEIKKIELEGDKVYLKKDSLGWRTVEPWRDEQGKLKWGNILFGGKRGIISLIFIMVIAGLLYLGINELIESYKTIAESPCDFCEDCHLQTRRIIEGMDLQTKFPEVNYSDIFKEANSG